MSALLSAPQVEQHATTESARRRRLSTSVPFDPERLRSIAWEIGSRRAVDRYQTEQSYVVLMSVSPSETLAGWRLNQARIDETRAARAGVWDGARQILRLYDVSYILFNGLNAHRTHDFPVNGRSGECFLKLQLGGTFQLAEIGFLLRTGEFVPAARSNTVEFPLGAVSVQQEHAALYVDERLKPEPVGSPWEGESYLRARSLPKLRRGLRIALLALESRARGDESGVGRLVSELAAALLAQGQEPHVLVPASPCLSAPRVLDGVAYHPLAVEQTDGPVAAALAFVRAAEARLNELERFNLFYLQEWMAALMPWLGTRPAALAMTSIEATRRNGAPASPLSLEIEKLEREAAQMAECVLVPPELRDLALVRLGVDATRLHPVAMPARPLDVWERRLDLAAVKSTVGLDPEDPFILFVGPLEQQAGPDLLVEAVALLLPSAAQAKLVVVGCGSRHGPLYTRAQQLGIGHAVRFLGHVEEERLAGILRACRALVLPSRARFSGDEGILNLARRAGRAAVTTHAGPAALVQHEQDGLVVYDNPSSLLWALTRLFDDPALAERLAHGRQQASDPFFGDLARALGELCAAAFPELCEQTAEARPCDAAERSSASAAEERAADAPLQGALS